MKKTKIVCTIGPASDNPKMLKKLVKEKILFIQQKSQFSQKLSLENTKD